MVADFFDFDSWYDTHQPNPDGIRFKALGQDWTLPGDIPAATMLKLQRLRMIADTGTVPPGVDVTDLSYEGLTREMVGDDLVDQWLELGMRSAMLQGITRRLHQLYLGQDPDDDQGDGEDVGGKAPTAPTPDLVSPGGS